MIVNGVRLAKEDIVFLRNSAEIAQKLENKWDRFFAKTIKEHAYKDSDRVSIGGELIPPPFEKMFIEHYFEVSIAALKLAEREKRLSVRLAGPRSLKQIMDLYDRWRKGLWKPKKIVKEAQKIKTKYIESVQKAWKKYSDDFRNGGPETQEDIRKKIQDEAETTTPRAQNIVRTETTRYYNEVRRDYYDKSEDVTHYLFIAVRDKGTTPWCCRGHWSGGSGKKKSIEKQFGSMSGKSGRSGVIYEKGSALLVKETPPIHWQCRSELLPLNKFNPTHRRMIADESMHRENVECYPLPPGWNK